MRTYRRRVTEVFAEQLTADNAETLARWSGGEIVDHIDPFDNTKREPAINMPTLDGNVRVQIGDYVVRTAQGQFSRCSKAEFENAFEPA